jgi:hypothetical protein
VIGYTASVLCGRTGGHPQRSHNIRTMPVQAQSSNELTMKPGERRRSSTTTNHIVPFGTNGCDSTRPITRQGAEACDRHVIEAKKPNRSGNAICDTDGLEGLHMTYGHG